MRLSTAHLSIVGPRRHINDDFCGLYRDLGLYLVADDRGDIAFDGVLSSELAVQTVANYLQKQIEIEQPTWPFQVDKAQNFQETQLRLAMKLASYTVHKKGDEEDLGFGASLVALWFVESSVLVTHAGNCRAYRIREKEIEAFTEDHTLLQEYIRMKQMSPEEIRDFPHKDVLTRGIFRKDLRVDVEKRALQKGDVYLLSTVGLHENVSDEEMLRIIQETENLQEACEKLIASATQNPRCDNCTVVLIRVEA
jgi:serine/threonine protein phosphatase PrpC